MSDEQVAERTVKDELVEVLAETLGQMLLHEHGAIEEPRVDPSRRQRRAKKEQPR
jgi:hypothetical protein